MEKEAAMARAVKAFFAQTEPIFSDHPPARNCNDCKSPYMNVNSYWTCTKCGDTETCNRTRGLCAYL